MCCIRKRHRPKRRACSIRWSRVLCQASVRTPGSASRSVATVWIRCSPIRRAPRSIIPHVDAGTWRSVANAAWVYPACWRSWARVLAAGGVDRKSPTVLPRTSAVTASWRGPGELWPVSQWLTVVASSPAAIARSSWVRFARCLAWRNRSGEKPWVRALDSEGSWSRRQCRPGSSPSRFRAQPQLCAMVRLYPHRRLYYRIWAACTACGRHHRTESGWSTIGDGSTTLRFLASVLVTQSSTRGCRDEAHRRCRGTREPCCHAGHSRTGQRVSEPKIST
jgi:hypothetical protein